MSEVGEWCECLALVLPRIGDSEPPVAKLALNAAQHILERCEWTALSDMTAFDASRAGAGGAGLDDNDGRTTANSGT